MENNVNTEEVRAAEETVEETPAAFSMDEVKPDFTSSDYQSAADRVLALITNYCIHSVSAYTNPHSEPSYEDTGKQLSVWVGNYNTLSKAAALRTCFEADQPSLKAVELLEYTTVSVTEKTVHNGITDLKHFEHKTKATRLDLREVEGYCRQNDKVFAPSSDWFHTIEKLCCVLTMARAKEIGIPADQIAVIDASFLMSRVARDVQLASDDPEHPNPLSKNQIVKNLSVILTQLVGSPYHVDTRDAAFLRGCFAGQGRTSLSMKTANSKRLCDIVLQVAHRSVFDKSYTIQAAVKKERNA